MSETDPGLMLDHTTVTFRTAIPKPHGCRLPTTRQLYKAGLDPYGEHVVECECGQYWQRYSNYAGDGWARVAPPRG